MDCFALAAWFKRHWSTPWAGIVAQSSIHGTGSVFRDTLGRRHPQGHVPYIVFPCNDPRCPATLLVRGDTIVEELGVLPPC